MKRKYNVAKATNRKLGSRQVPPRREVHGQLRPSDLVVPVGVGLSPRRPTFLYWSLPIWIHFLDQSVTLDYATAIVRRQTTHSLTRGSCRDAWSWVQDDVGRRSGTSSFPPHSLNKTSKKKKKTLFYFLVNKKRNNFFFLLTFCVVKNWKLNWKLLGCVLCFTLFFLKDWSILWLLLKTNVLPWLLLV